MVKVSPKVRGHECDAANGNNEDVADIPCCYQGERMPDSDMEKLWNALFPLAEKQLRRIGVFSPFAAAMRLDGTMVRVPENSMRDCQTDVVRVGALTELLEQQARASRIRACCICYKITLNRPDNRGFKKGIRCNLEAVSGAQYTADLPYALFEFRLLGLKVSRRVCLGAC